MMLDNKSRSILRLLVSGKRFRIKKYDTGGVGLGIVAALDKSCESGLALCNSNLNRVSDPVPVSSPGNSARFRGDVIDGIEMDGLEDYTVVTCRGPNKPYTKVYFDGLEQSRISDDRTNPSFSVKTNRNRASVFDITPARSVDLNCFPASDFLSSCDMCQKKLHGKDIYMYRGEKAFCSPECRYRQIVMDERKEKCSCEVSRSVVEVANSPYTNDNIFSTGILAI